MIELSKALITDSLPSIIASQPETQALAFAIGRQTETIYELTGRTRVLCNISGLDGFLLDILAIEFKTPEYSENFSLEIKRELIKRTLQYYLAAGTVKAIEDICSAIFGDAGIEEWYEYGGTQGRFKIVTTNPSVTGTNIDEFKKAAEGTKRMTAWLDGVILKLTAEQVIYLGGFLHERTDHYFTFNKDI